MKFHIVGPLLVLAFLAPLAEGAAADPAIRQETVRFAAGASAVTINDRIAGDAMVDYTIRAAAGQTLNVQMQESNPQNYFNVMPPGSTGSAMFVGDTGDDYAGVLPGDGDYVIRVYLMRPAARRGESSNYTLTVGVSGAPLAPIAASTDALLPGTSYHASATIDCVPAFESAPSKCEVFVIRRGFDGTATIDIPGSVGNRSILIVKGTPVASNAQAMDTLSYERRGDVTIVKLGATERYEIPDALVVGG